MGAQRKKFTHISQTDTGDKWGIFVNYDYAGAVWPQKPCRLIWEQNKHKSVALVLLAHRFRPDTRLWFSTKSMLAPVCLQFSQRVELY